MSLTNLEQEMVWINAWNDLEELINKFSDGYILLPSYIEASKDEAESWIQNSAYESQKIEFSVEYYKGRKSIFINKVLA